MSSGESPPTYYRFPESNSPINNISLLTSYGKLKSRRLSNIDIQLYDEFGRFIQMNGIHYCITLQLNIYRKYMNQPRVLDIKPLELVLDRIENDLEVIQEQLPQNQDSTDL